VIYRVSGTFSLALKVFAVGMELANKGRITLDSVLARPATSFLIVPFSATQNCVRPPMEWSIPCATNIQGAACA